MGKSSKYKGVSWSTKTLKWKARFREKGYGHYESEREAAIAVDKQRIKAGLEPMILKPKSETT